MRVAALGIVGTSNDAHSWVAISWHRNPQTLGVVRPSTWLTNNAITPLLQGDIVVASFVVHAVNEATGKKGVSVWQETRDAFGFVKSVCFRGSCDDSVGGGGGTEEELCQ